MQTWLYREKAQLRKISLNMQSSKSDWKFSQSVFFKLGYNGQGLNNFCKQKRIRSGQLRSIKC